MVEAGGPANQAGIRYQNTITALYLGRMIDLRARRVGERIVRVRPEAPQPVDDANVWLADGARTFIQAKLSLQKDSASWDKLWVDVCAQSKNLLVQPNDTIVIVTPQKTRLLGELEACCERASTSMSAEEFLQRATISQAELVDAIRTAMGNVALSIAVRALARTHIDTLDIFNFDADQYATWLPPSDTKPETLLTILRDIAGDAGRRRQVLTADDVRQILHRDHGVRIVEPSDWGAAKYRQLIIGRASAIVPGTGVVRPLDDSYPWPICVPAEPSRTRDIDDEATAEIDAYGPSHVDLSLFPSFHLQAVVLTGGPGLGKSLVVKALAAKAARDGKLPAVVSIPDLSAADATVLEFLDSRINREAGVSIDWRKAAEAGLLIVFFDGLDEVGPDRRVAVLERVNTFALAYPDTPFLLTVRDPSAVPSSVAAIQLEISSLDDKAIGRTVAFYRPGDKQFCEAMLDRLSVRPELKRLARIPLFLAIMTALGDDARDPVHSRTDLLEKYLHLLFRPDHYKSAGSPRLGVETVRLVAEAAAFRALEHQQVGISHRLLSTVVKSHAPDFSPDDIADDLVRCGALRRSGIGAYEFPFPIVQEYLAARFMLENCPEDIERRITGVTLRPWVQTLQFALEQHPDAAGIAGRLLSTPDDAFSSQLRLVARCVSNGMPISTPQRADIAARLGRIWPAATWHMREKIGDVIADAFSSPMVREVRSCLSSRGLRHHGTGRVLDRLRDDALTEQVLASLLEGDLEHFYHLGSVQSAVDRMGDRAFTIYVDRYRNSDRTEEDSAAISCLIHHLAVGSVSSSVAKQTYDDAALPASIRLAALWHTSNGFDEAATRLIKEALKVDAFQPRSIAGRLLERHPQAMDIVRHVLTSTDLSDEAKLKIVDSIPSPLRVPIAEATHDAEPISPEVRRRLDVFAASTGHNESLEKLVRRASELELADLGAAASLFGWHRSSDSLVKIMLDGIGQRPLTAHDKVVLASQLSLGMNHRFEMISYRTGTVERTPPHPGLKLAAALVAEWAAGDDFSPREALEIDTSLSEMGDREGRRRLPERIAAVLRVQDLDLGNDGAANDLSQAIRVLESFRGLLSLDVLSEVVSRAGSNAASSAIRMMSSHASHEALQRLLEIYRTRTDWLQNTAYDALEQLSGRLGVRLVAQNGSLEVQQAS